MTEDDLLVPSTNGSDIKYLLEQKLLPEDIQEVRNIVSEFDPTKLDRYNDGLVYSAYYAARNCDGFSQSTLCKKLGISKKLFNYYMEKYPKFNIAVNTGFADKRSEMETSLVEKLYSLAMGSTITDETQLKEELFDADGVSQGYKIKTGQKVTQVPPDQKAIIALLGKLNDSWNPKYTVDVTGEVQHNLNVAADINIDIDYKKLSVVAIKDILASQTVSSQGKIERLNEAYNAPIKSDLIEVTEKQKQKAKQSTCIVKDGNKQLKKLQDLNKQQLNELMEDSNGKTKQSKTNDGGRKRNIITKFKT